MPQDRAIWSILGANALTLAMALWQEWGLIHLLWPFWMQSVAIGWFSRQRLMRLREFSTEGFRINGQPVAPTAETARKTGNFFALHFGLFHFIYLVFLLSFSFGTDASGMVAITDAETGAEYLIHVGKLHWLDWPLLLALGAGFWASHRQSFNEHIEADLRRKPNIGSMMFLPYIRVVPMHLAVGLGVMVGGTGAVWIFVLLKTGADVVMHWIEHRWLQSGDMKKPQASQDAVR